MSGLQTKIQIPKLSAGATARFVAESGAVGDQTQTTAQITMQALNTWCSNRCITTSAFRIRPFN